MKSAVLTAVGLAVMSSSAFADDLSTRDWTGAYVGVHAGALRGDVSVLDDVNDGVDPGPFAYSITGFFGGGTAGYNWQAGNLVFGAEGDIGYLSPSGSGMIGSAHVGNHQDLTLGGGVYGEITARAGLAFGSTLIYAKGGWAYFGGSAMQKTTADGYMPTGTGAFSGWTGGGGVEQMLTDAISAKVEYQHFDFGTQEASQTNVGDTSSPIGYVFHNWHTLGIDTIKVGLNYHF